jgi:hypothetical protein
MEKVSELFEVDVEALIEYFEKMSREAENVKSYIDNFSEVIIDLERLAYELLTIEILLQRKLVKYRYHDRIAWNYLTKISKQIDYLFDIIKKMKEISNQTNSYGFNSTVIYKYLDEIYDTAQEGIEIVKRAVREGAFE